MVLNPCILVILAYSNYILNNIQYIRIDITIKKSVLFDELKLPLFSLGLLSLLTNDNLASIE